jgi:hypothetical protein
LPNGLNCKTAVATSSGGFDVERLRIEQIASLVSPGSFWAGLLKPTIVVELPAKRARRPTRGVPSRYTGDFTSVDRLERCYANDDYAVCTAGPSRKSVRLVVRARVSYEGITRSTDKGGPAMPLGASFRTPAGTIECGSSRRGITCTDLTTGSYFVIGDYRVRINNGSGEVAR